MSEEIIQENWFSRLSGAVKGMLTGAIIFVIAFPLLWWNEGRAVKTARALTEGAAAVVETGNDHVDPADDGRFVHLSGEATTEELLEDPDFGVAVNAVRLERKVEMHQWQQDVDSKTRKKLGGGTETIKTYSYRKTWSDRAIKSDGFRDAGHDNPVAFPLKGFVRTARDVRLGIYQLPDSLVSSIRRSEELAVNLADVPADWRAAIRPHGSNGFYLPAGHSQAPAQNTADVTTQHTQPAAGRSGAVATTNAQEQPAAGSPQIGDVRITYTVTRPTTVSILSEQAGNSFTAFRTSNGKSLNMLAMGTVPASDMIARAEAENTAWTWGLRVAGFVMMGIGLGLVLKPLSVLADVLPIAGDFVQTGTGLISFCVAGACSLTTISVAWVFYRPLIGVPLLLAGVGLLSTLVYFLLKARASRSTAPAAKSVEVASVSTNDPVSDPVSESVGADEPVSIEDIDEAISI